MALYEIGVRYNNKTGKTSFSLFRDGKDYTNPTAEELKIYFSVLKLVMDKVGLKLKTELEKIQ